MIVVTGGMGFLGLHVSRALLDCGQDVIITQHRTTRRPEFLDDVWGTRVVAVQVDLRNIDEVKRLFADHDVTGLVHLAVPPRFGVTPGDEMRAAAEMFLPVITTAIEMDVDRLVMASSLAVYFGNDAPIWREDDPIRLDSTHPIAAIKRSEEAVASYLAHASGADVIRARITAVWGPLYQTMLNAPARLALLAADRADHLRDLPDPRDAHPDDELELMYVRDCARAIAQLQCAERLDHDIYNVGGIVVRYADLVSAANAAGAKETIELRPPDRAPIVAHRLDDARLRNTGFTATTDVEQGMTEYVAWLRQHDS